MATDIPSSSEPELVQIAIDGSLYYAFKWWDELETGGRAVRYVVKDPTCGVVSYMLILCAPRIPCGTGLAAVKFYPVEGADQHTDLWPAETTWENGDTDIESAIRICSPKTAFQAYRGLPGDLEQMIREHKAGKRQAHPAGKKGTPLEAIHAVHADVRDLKQSVSPLPSAVALLGKGVETVLQHARGLPKVLDDLEEAQTVPENATREILAKIQDVLTLEEQRIWTTVRKAGTQKGALEELRESGIVISEATLSRRMKEIKAKLRENGLGSSVASGPAARYRKTGGHKNDDGKSKPVEISPVEKDWAKDPSDRDATIQSYLASRSEKDKTYFREIYLGIEDEAEKYLKHHPLKSR